MTDDQPRPRSSIAVLLIVGAVLLSVLYVLSIGPVQWSVNRGYLPSWTSGIYSPLWSLAANCEPAQTALWWYLEQLSVYPAPRR